MSVTTVKAGHFQPEPQILTVETEMLSPVRPLALEPDRGLDSAVMYASRLMTARSFGMMELEPEVSNYPTWTPTQEPTFTPTPPSPTPTPQLKPDAPILAEEPGCSPGLTNEIFWSDPSVMPADEYWAMCALDPEFEDIVQESDWIDDLNYEFTGLEHNEVYYYSVQSRYLGGEESDWSNTVWSRQDAEPPIVWIGGFWDTYLEYDNYSMLTVMAFVPEEPVTIEILFDGVHTGLFLKDNGEDGDERAGDGFYTHRSMFFVSLEPEDLPVSLEIKDCAGNHSTMPWPDLWVY